MGCERQPGEPRRSGEGGQNSIRERHGDEHHRPEGRIDPPGAADEVAGDRGRLAEGTGLRVGDDEPGDDEEEIDAAVAEPEERPQEFAGDAEVRLPPRGVDAEHQKARDAAQPLQIPELRAHDPSWSGSDPAAAILRIGTRRQGEVSIAIRLTVGLEWTVRIGNGVR